jgi:hypothetical protein
MKTKTAILALTLIFLGTGLLSAQTGKGKFLIGESINISFGGTSLLTTMNLGWGTYKVKSDNDDDRTSKRFSLNLSPKFGYFVANNLAVGIDFGIVTSKYESGDGDYKQSYNQFTAGPFLRYYVPTEKVLPYAEVSYGIGSSKHKTDNIDVEHETKYFNQQYGFGIGLGVPLGEKVTFDSQIGYHSFMYKAKEDNEDNRRSIFGVFGLKLGVTILL